MTNFIDKNGCAANIELTDKRTGLPWERDFFEVGGLRYNEAKNAYIVDDVYYLTDRVEDYMQGRGDFAGETPGRELADLYCALDIPQF